MVLEVFVTKAYSYFGGVENDFNRAKVIVVGVPFESSTTYKTGTRFAPYAIRIASSNIEFYSMRADIDVDEVPIYDLGDITISGNRDETLKRIEEVAAILADNVDSKLIVFLGGEHTITLGVIRGLIRRRKNICVISIDAHFDLREEYLDDKLSHACVMRRVAELVSPQNMVFYGVRAFSGEEKEYVLENNITYVDAREILKSPTQSTAKILEKINDPITCTHVHVSIDMDVYDPSYAPGVGNPEPEGLTPSIMFDFIHRLISRLQSNNQTITVDVVEVSPPNDCNDVTSILAAKTIVEIIASWYLSKHSNSKE